MAEELGEDLVPVGIAQSRSIAECDVVGFWIRYLFLETPQGASPVCGDAAGCVRKKKVFIYSTSGKGGIEKHTALKELLVNRGFSIVGEFSCKGWDTFGPMNLFWGINKGRPSEDDLAAARAFVRGLKDNV